MPLPIHRYLQKPLLKEMDCSFQVGSFILFLFSLGTPLMFILIIIVYSRVSNNVIECIHSDELVKKIPHENTSR